MIQKILLTETKNIAYFFRSISLRSLLEKNRKKKFLLLLIICI